MGLLDIFTTRKTRDSSARNLKPIASRGSQQTFNLEANKVGVSPLYGIRQPQDLDKFRSYYLTHWLARRIVNSLVRLTLSDITTRSENDDLDRRILEFNRSIQLKRCLAAMLAQYFCYGAAYAEIVTDSPTDPSDVLGLHVVDSRSMRVDLDPYGRVRAFVQLPQTLGVVTNGNQPIRVEPTTMIHLVRDPLGDSIYGQSALQAIEDELQQSKHLERAMTKSAIRSVTGQDLFTYMASEGESQDEAQEALDGLVSQYDNAEPGDPLFAAGQGEWQRLSPSTLKPPQMRSEYEALIAAGISGADLTPAALGLNVGQSMHEAAEQRIVLLSMIESVQSQLTEQLNSKLYRSFSDIHNTPEIYVEMKTPTLMSEKEKAETETIKLNNSGLKAKMGVINGQTLSQELGYDQLDDEDLFTEWLESGQTLAEQRNPDDPNVSQQDQKTMKDNKPPTAKE